jgi:hypothetical protein
MGSQPGAARPGRAAGGEAEAEAVLSHDYTQTGTPEEVADERFLTILVAFSRIGHSRW